MSRTLSLALAAALVAGSMAVSAAPASAIEFGINVGSSGWGNDNWHNGNDDWRWRNRHHNRHSNRHRDFQPGFTFSFGAPTPYAYIAPRPRDDCYRTRDGRLYCRAY